MRLSGYMDIEVETKSTIDSFRIDGDEFSWEEGGEHSTSFLFVYSDFHYDFEISIHFTLDEQQVISWQTSVDAANVRVIDDNLNIENKYLSYDGDDYF